MPVDLEFLGKQTERILAELRAVREDVQNIKTRLTALESAFGLLITQIATLNNRIDRMEAK
jgi:hypothetical protein